MDEQDLYRLMEINNRLYESLRKVTHDNFIELDDFLKEKQKEMAKHYHFKTKKEMQAAMRKDCNPFSTFSWGKKKIND